MSKRLIFATIAATVLLVGGAFIARSDEVDELREQANKLLLEARELRQTGQEDKARQLAERAEALRRAAEELREEGVQ